MCKEYSKSSGDPSEFLYSEQIADSFHNPSIFLPDQLYNKYPAHVRIDLLARAHVSIESIKRRFFCMLRNTRSKLMRIIYHLKL